MLCMDKSNEETKAKWEGCCEWVTFFFPYRKKCQVTQFETGTLRERVFRWFRNSGQKSQGQTWGLCEGAEGDTFRVLFIVSLVEGHVSKTSFSLAM